MFLRLAGILTSSTDRFDEGVALFGEHHDRILAGLAGIHVFGDAIQRVGIELSVDKTGEFGFWYARFS